MSCSRQTLYGVQCCIKQFCKLLNLLDFVVPYLLYLFSRRQASLKPTSTIPFRYSLYFIVFTVLLDPLVFLSSHPTIQFSPFVSFGTKIMSPICFLESLVSLVPSPDNAVLYIRPLIRNKNVSPIMSSLHSLHSGQKCPLQCFLESLDFLVSLVFLAPHPIMQFATFVLFGTKNNVPDNVPRFPIFPRIPSLPSPSPDNVVLCIRLIRDNNTYPIMPSSFPRFPRFPSPSLNNAFSPFGTITQ